MEFANREGPVHDALAAALDRQVEALAQTLRRERAGGTIEPAQLAFELHARLTAANHRFRIGRDPAAFAHGRAAIRRLLQQP